MTRACRLLCLICCGLPVVLPSPGLAAEVPGTSLPDPGQQAYSRVLESLARRAEARGATELAHDIRESNPVRVSDRWFYFVPDSRPRARDEDSHFVARAFRAEQKGQAERLWQQAEALLRSDAWDQSYRLAHEVAYLDPTHEGAGRLLGMRRRADTASELDHSDDGSPPPGVDKENPRGVDPVATDSVPTSRILRPLGWTADASWRVNGDHFSVITNHSREAAHDLLRELETLHVVWRQHFVRFWATQRELRRAWAAGRALVPQGRHLVVLFRDRSEYVRFLQRAEPQAAMTLGMYRASENRCYFFVGDKDHRATWWHEATHQLCQETGRTRDHVGETSDFWAVEGAALYMESRQRFPGYVTLGGIDAPRLQHARFRALNANTYFPLGKVKDWGRNQIQSHREIRSLYSQFAGTTHFLLDYRRGHFQASFMEYLRGIYAADDDAASVRKFSMLDLDALDREYLQSFLPIDDDRLTSLTASKTITKLCLGHCPVSDKGISGLGSLPIDSLTWLDLTGCSAVGDTSLEWISRAVALRQLGLESTAIGDPTLQQLAGLTALEELDLSGTRITDAGLRQLGGLPRLRVLYLTNTRVSDQGLDQLSNVHQLQHLDVQGTRIRQDRQRVLPEP